MGVFFSDSVASAVEWIAVVVALLMVRRSDALLEASDEVRRPKPRAP